MSIFDHGLQLLQAIATWQFALAAATFSGMVLTMLGAFYLIDAVRFPPELVRTGRALRPVYDDIVVVQGIPWEPIWKALGPVPRLLQSLAAGIIGAGAFALIVGVGYRRGPTGALVGVCLGLGMGLAVALRPVALWAAQFPLFSPIVGLIRLVLYFASYFSATIVLFVLELLLGLVLFTLLLIAWLALLPWLVFAWIVRKFRKRPAHTTALVAPFAFLAMLPASVAKSRRERVWRDPRNDSLSARLTRWVLGQLPTLQKFLLGVVIGQLYAIVGRPLVTEALGSPTGAWLALGAVLAFGLVVERAFEMVVESLYVDDLTGFVDEGPTALAGLRVGLLTGLGLGTLVGLTTSQAPLIHAATDLARGVAPQNVSVVVATGIVGVLLWLVPAVLGYAAPRFVSRLTIKVRHIRAGLWITGGIMCLLGVALQVLQQFVITG